MAASQWRSEEKEIIILAAACEHVGKLNGKGRADLFTCVAGHGCAQAYVYTFYWYVNPVCFYKGEQRFGGEDYHVNV